MPKPGYTTQGKNGKNIVSPLPIKGDKNRLPPNLPHKRGEMIKTINIIKTRKIHVALIHCCLDKKYRIKDIKISDSPAS